MVVVVVVFVACCIRRRLITCVRCHVRTTASETEEALALPVSELGTVCHVASEHLTSVTNILKHYWRHICLTRPRRFVTFYISALEILLLTYLLTCTYRLSQDAWSGSTVALHDDVLRWTAGRLVVENFPAVDGTTARPAQKADLVPTLRPQVFVWHG